LEFVLKPLGKTTVDEHQIEKSEQRAKVKKKK
jgi:hypothetical protein